MRKDPTRNTRQTHHRAAAKAAGGALISTPIGPEAAQALERMRKTMTIREAIETALTSYKPA